MRTSFFRFTNALQERVCFLLVVNTEAGQELGDSGESRAASYKA